MANSAVNEAVVFKRTSYEVTISIERHNGAKPGEVSGRGFYAPGETVTLSASSSSEGYFIGWETDDVVIPSHNAFTMPSKDVSVTAVYDRDNM